MPAVISDLTAAVVFAMVDRPLRRRIRTSEVHPDAAAVLQTDLEELRRAGGEWKR